ncbi:diguanylate cyclase [Marinomonas ushuaiensis DSM 15871]|uniref:diguanylate cyclase n=1 Tax=Marinomonas ushuaiensis DSM 15871 TaxID=1122207 RepID=X7EAN9_9GAMM|nr:diguanylate cyclase [Marinomonas ushuaiensis]ETX12281.1 diguanylate cyclase [Marinomonas ushuaiensis DSM 15871]
MVYNIRKNDIRLQDILNTTPISVVWSNVSSGRVEYINKSFKQLFGFTLQDLPDIRTWCLRVSNDEYFFQNIIQPWLLSCHGDSSAEDLKTQLLCKDGSIRQVSMSFSTVGDKRLWYFNDVTDYWIAEKRLRTQSDMLEMVAKSSALKDILNLIVKQIQLESPNSLCSVLLFNKTEQCLKLGAAPDFPDFYNDAVDGLKIGMNVGSCGAAAYLGERIIVEDITTHKNWTGFNELAKKANVAACWSDPIMSSKGDLLGTFAIYKHVPSSPTDKDFELINFASNLVSIAIESFKAQEELEKRAYYDHLTGLLNRGSFFQQCESVLNKTSTPLSIVMMDIDYFKKVNDAYGHKAGDLVLQKLAEVSQLVLRQNDVIARIGGEEFAILLPSTKQEGAIKVANTLRLAIEKSRVIGPDNQEIHVTVSLGIAYKEGGYCSVDELLSQADKALYQSKNAGRNCVHSLECHGRRSLF